MDTGSSMGWYNSNGSAYYDPAQDWNNSGTLNSADTATGSTDPFDWRRVLGSTASAAGKALSQPPMSSSQSAQMPSGGGMDALQSIPLQYLIPLMQLSLVKPQA
jgi:hypothetical protein